MTSEEHLCGEGAAAGSYVDEGMGRLGLSTLPASPELEASGEVDASGVVRRMREENYAEVATDVTLFGAVIETVRIQF